MKKSVLFFPFLLLTGISFAQKKNIFKANIFSPVVKSGSFFFERVLTSNKSAELGVGFTSYSPGSTKISGVFITPEFRFYLSDDKTAPHGFYVAPFLRYQNLNIEDKANGDKATLSTIGGGVVIGHQWILKDLVSIDLFLGPNYNSGTLKVTNTQNPTNFDVPGAINGFGIRSGVTLGIAF